MSESFTYQVSSNETSWLPVVLDAPHGVGDSHFVRVNDPIPADFAWFHRVNAANAAHFESARIRGGNGVSGTMALEDKFNLGLLMAHHGIAKLHAYFMIGAHQVRKRCEELFNGSQSKEGTLWMLKDAGANGGDGLYVISGENWHMVMEGIEMMERETKRMVRYVMQEYIASPDLWQGEFKYHIRMYLVLRGDGAAYLHRDALIHVANKPFSTEATTLADSQVHLTNVSKNHHNKDLFHGCPIVNLAQWLGEEKMAAVLKLFEQVFVAARPFILHQISADDFSHIGADIMIDSSNQPHLLECNIPPCIGNYNSEMPQEQHEFFHNLFRSMVADFVCGQLVATKVERKSEFWVPVCSPRENFAKETAKSRGLNNLAWKVFERRCLQTLMNN